jgi:hypothetical protein
MLNVTYKSSSSDAAIREWLGIADSISSKADEKVGLFV